MDCRPVDVVQDILQEAFASDIDCAAKIFVPKLLHRRRKVVANGSVRNHFRRRIRSSSFRLGRRSQLDHIASIRNAQGSDLLFYVVEMIGVLGFVPVHSHSAQRCCRRDAHERETLRGN